MSIHRRPFGYDPPQIAWIADHKGHHPEPAPDPHANNLESLRYEAALVKAHCGVDCRIGQLNGPDTYDYVIYGLKGNYSVSGNCGEYRDARAFLYGVELGALAGRSD